MRPPVRSRKAAVQDHEHYSFPYSDDFTMCGFPVHLDGVRSGNARNRVGLGDLDTAYFGLDNCRVGPAVQSR